MWQAEKLIPRSYQPDRENDLVNQNCGTTDKEQPRSHVIKWLWYFEYFSYFSVSYSKKATFISAACFNFDPKKRFFPLLWHVCIGIQHISHFDVAHTAKGVTSKMVERAAARP